jgi:hypothetical protein
MMHENGMDDHLSSLGGAFTIVATPAAASSGDAIDRGKVIA